MGQGRSLGVPRHAGQELAAFPLSSLPFGSHSNLLLLIVLSITVKANSYPLLRFKMQLPTATHCTFPAEILTAALEALTELFRVCMRVFVCLNKGKVQIKCLNSLRKAAILGRP